MTMKKGKGEWEQVRIGGFPEFDGGRTRYKVRRRNLVKEQTIYFTGKEDVNEDLSRAGLKLKTENYASD